jgi:FHS family glucose/mannose:H+ symporter-like MFS transporter
VAARDAPTPGRIALPRTALASVAITFVLIGVLASAYGPLLGLLTQRFGVSLSVAGTVLSAHFAGALLGVVISMRALEWVPGRSFVTAALLCLAAGCAGVALARSWPAFLVAVFVIGLGFGALDIGLNQLVAHSEGARRTAVLNVLNGAYGIGAIAGPILVAVFGAQHLPLLYGGAAALAVGVLPLAATISGRLPVVPRKPYSGPGRVVAIFGLGFVAYVATEAGTGGWMTSHLESVGLQTATAAALTSGFWLALALGRLVVVLVPPRVPEPVIVLAACAGGALALSAAAASSSIAPYAYLVAGFAIAPIFPTGIVWLAKLRPGDSRATSWLFPASMIGGVVGPAAMAAVVARYGVGPTPLMLTVAAFAALGAFALAARTSRA